MSSIDSAVRPRPDVQSDARRAVDQMLDHGVHFSVRCRENGNPDFLWELPQGGNRSACRKIISDAKTESASYWHAFVAAIVEAAGELVS